MVADLRDSTMHTRHGVSKDLPPYWSSGGAVIAFLIEHKALRKKLDVSHGDQDKESVRTQGFHLSITRFNSLLLQKIASALITQSWRLYLEVTVSLGFSGSEDDEGPATGGHWARAVLLALGHNVQVVVSMKRE
jgi:hypothetical protein